MKRFAVATILAITLLPRSVAAQEGHDIPEVDVLAEAVQAISTMHMDDFTTAALWAAALDGMKEELGEDYAHLFAKVDGQTPGALLAGAVAEVRRSSESADADSLAWEAAIDGLIDALNDPYAELFTAREAAVWEEDTSGNYSGIGLQITLLNDEITITAVFRGFPASEHGIVVGDVIVGVDEHDATDWGTDMAADSIRGPVGTDVEVRIKRQGYPEPVAFTITRAQVHTPAVEWDVLDGDIGYVVMDRVARNAAREMSEALSELEDHKGLIIDLRRNPGGFLDESLMLADLFLERGTTLASTSQRVPGSATADSSEVQSYSDRWPQFVPDLPVVVLVDEFTASGAEILAGALQDYDRAIVLGERSFGKGVVQTVLPMPHNRRLRFTTGTWLTPIGRSLQRARDSQGFPLEEDVATLPRVTTEGGRTLLNGGGIFPDLEITDDTLTTKEQDFIRQANEQEFPLGLRIVEYGFEVASARRDAEKEPGLTDAELETFLTNLREEGLESELLVEAEIVDYLRWRVKMAVAQRMDDLAAEATFRVERDPVLGKAIALLMEARSQNDLFRAVDAPTVTGGR